MWRVGYVSAVLTVLGLVGCEGAAFTVLGLTRSAGATEREFVAQVKNKPAPDFELTALDGAKVRLSDQRGKPVLLAFFAYS